MGVVENTHKINAIIPGNKVEGPSACPELFFLSSDILLQFNEGVHSFFYEWIIQKIYPKIFEAKMLT